MAQPLPPPPAPGRIVLLNGAPRSGKSSIARALQAGPGAWFVLGTDAVMAMTPPALLPGIGLRPGGERPDLEPWVVASHAALAGMLAALSDAGLDAVADVGHHEGHSRPLSTLRDAARRLARRPAWLIGVRCPLDAVMARRNADPQGGHYAGGATVPAPVARWQEAVHDPGIYDLEVDTARRSPEACAAAIRDRLAAGHPTAVARLAAS